MVCILVCIFFFDSEVLMLKYMYNKTYPYLLSLLQKVKWCIYKAPFPCNMLKGALQWSVYPQQTGSIHRCKRRLLQISPCMLVLILPTPEGWKAEWTLTGKKVTHSKYSTLDQAGNRTGDLRIGRQRSLPLSHIQVLKHTISYINDFTTDKMCHSLKFITQPVVIEPKPFNFGYKS